MAFDSKGFDTGSVGEYDLFQSPTMFENLPDVLTRNIAISSTIEENMKTQQERRAFRGSIELTARMLAALRSVTRRGRVGECHIVLFFFGRRERDHNENNP
jgi:hypothetical protein